MTTWLKREWRLLRAGNSPLAGRWERIEARFLAVAIVLSVLALPVAALVGSTVYNAQVLLGERQSDVRHQATAVTVDEAPPAAAVAGDVVTFQLEQVTVRWTLPGGEARTGTTAVEPGTAAGTAVPVWLDAAGGLTARPVSPADAAGIATAAGALVAFVAAVAAAMLITGARLVFGRLRQASLAREWERFGRDSSRY
ncbi:Rv1733c family protein [Amycolatopsis alkalitolerans]|uniref:Transmembrane protein n=1 Tax=Amycolatopsis alkalitolerans TaxID=2547244 RepID=A0A5C4LVW3_9PSEU|nr:hypothetical protein [Amycolatopsis alkalitolerans]TNC20479.1 hypothetical protein FG385_30965 [Amycolatopsis alkalitolerans]